MRQIHVAGFFQKAVEEADGGGVIELRPVVGGDGAGGGDGDFPFVARGFEGADDGGHGVGEAA